MHELLLGLQNADDAAMVPYILGNTMSENGGVTRGICRVEDGMLKDVCETKEICYGKDREIVSERGALPADAMVSMNMWGFHKDLLARMNDYFETFLKQIPDGDIKAECLLPIMVGEFLADGGFSVRAEASHDKWFGITYAADRELVMEKLAELHAAGDYPERLF